MKKIMLLTAAFAIVAGCTTEEKFFNRNEQTVTKEFNVTFASVTRTSIDSELNVDWNAGDVIRYYSAASGPVKTFTVPDDGHSILIKTEIGTKDSFVIAAYGADGITDNTEKVCTLTGAVKAEQSGAFADAHISIAKTCDVNSGTLAFSNLTSLIKFSLMRRDVSYIVFSSNDSTKLHANGQLKISFSNTAISAAFPEGESGYSIKVNAGDSGTFYIATLPCESKGFTMKLYDSNGIALGQVTSDKTLTIRDNQIVNLGALDSRITETEIVDLSADGTANCYIVSEKGRYKFKTVKGNGDESVGNVKGVKVLWESFGTDVTPSVGDLIKADVSYANDYISFNTNDIYKEGNAVIAAYSDSGCTDGNVLWSWHIWLTDKPERQVYDHSAGTMMDRNLGATSAAQGTAGSCGLLYQWGRKDPFPGGSNQYDCAASTLNWPPSVSSNSSNGTIAYTVAHPTTFITYNSNNRDWHYTGSSSTDNTRWRKTKTIYDPCPAGWRVPDGGSSGVWSTAFGTSSYYGNAPWDNTNRGMGFFQSGSAVTVWYPASGCKSHNSGLLYGIGLIGFHWSCTPDKYYSYSMRFGDSGDLLPSGNCYRADGCSIRCLSE